MNDDQIIQLFFTRNEDAIRQTACRYGAPLTRLSENIIRNSEDAQEMEECIPGTWQDETADSADISRSVGAFLQRLMKENRMIFVRRYWYGDSVGEIAQRFGVSQSAVMMRLSRTRSKLASYLKKEGISV